jgi:4-hydroxythreonine-4-phosphate dehydrogenase
MGKHKKLKVGITAGDLNGIGLEVVIKSLMDSRVYEHCIPIVYASEKVVKSHMHELKLEGFHFNVSTSAEKIDATKVNVIDVWKEDVEVKFGHADRAAGQYAYKSLKAAVEDLASTKIDVLVTAPIDKKTIQHEEFNFPGHTEFLAAYANEDNPLMILVHDQLRVALVTGHIPIEKIARSLSKDAILEKLRVFTRSLKQDFGVHRPKIAVLGLNPHNGDDGLMGEEENNVISPAISAAKEEGLLAFGPYPADGFFGSPLRKKFDGILAMYHDQGLAPFKALSFDEGVNFTAGLPIVRTSPDHGVAYDIAGKNLASENSMRQAILLACDIALERRHYKEISANPLPLSESEA